MRSVQRGFSLIELLIVVAIILIIAAIAIPSLMRSRIVANQASAIGSCRSINTAEVSYYTNYGIGYPGSLVTLGPPAAGAQVTATAAGLLDSVLAGGFKSGYSFTYSPTMADAYGHFQGYVLNANPSQPGVSGTNYYYTDQTLVIRGNTTGTASASDSAVAN